MREGGRVRKGEESLSDSGSRYLTLTLLCAPGDVVAPAAVKDLVEGGDAEVTHVAPVALA